jgi:TolB-like protein/Tfp pilus assembly protein PilF
MTSERLTAIEEIFHAALDCAPDQLSAFLNKRCAGDEVLRGKVEELLAAHRQAESFETPIAALAASIIENGQADLLVGQTIGHYKISKRIGTGGMGEVYLASDITAGRNAALKLLPMRFTGDAVRLQRFQQEARAVVGLNHPNVLTVYEIGQIQSIHYIASELIEGETLRERLTRGRMQLSEAVEIAIQVAGALAAAHQAGIVHRDIKPENIMLRPDGYVKVLDFGIAKLAEQEVPLSVPRDEALLLVETNLGSILGTARYMSPEQARGARVDTRTDIWSLGAVLYEMVTGRAPFTGDTPREVMAAILTTEPPQLRNYIAQIPGELQQIVSKALRKDPEKRYQSANEMLEALKGLRRKLEFESFFMSGFFDEVKRRKVYRVAAAYIIVAAGIIQLASAAFPAWELPNWALRLVIVSLLIGFPLALILGWAFDITSQGIRVTPTAARGEHRRRNVIMLVAAGVIISATAGFFLLPRPSAHKIDKSIAVLPFQNLSEDKANAYLAEGIQEEILTRLAKIADLKVISRTSTQRFKSSPDNLTEIAKQLGVANILEGSVQRVADQVRVNVQLINAASDVHLWAESFDRKLTDIFAVETDIAKTIAETLRVRLTGTERQQLAKRPTENLRAFQYYLQGRTVSQRHTPEDMLTAIRYYEKAIQEDRNYALAYAGLADAYAVLGVFGYIAPVEGRHKAEEAARKGLALDNNLAEAHAALGLVYVQLAPSNFSLGDRELHLASELSPSFAMTHQYLGLSLVRQGRLDESIEEFQKARELDPLSSIIARGAALPYYLKRDYARALELLRQANELGPALSATWEIGVYVQNRLFNEALAELEKAKQDKKSDPILIYSTGMVYAAQGKRAEALQIIKELEEISGVSLSQAHWIAKIYAALNEKELAFSWLDRGLAAGAIGAFYRNEPVWDPIRSDPRFEKIVASLATKERQ